MGTSTLNIAVTGLNAAQAGLLTTSHNISNASTAGFNRQRVVQTTQNPQYTGSGFFGQGTRVQTVQRTYSEFLSGQVNTSQATTSQLESYLNQLGLIDNMLGDTTVGLSPAITSFFSGVNAVAATPSSIPARQTMLASAQTVVARFQDLASRLQEIFDGTNTQIRTEVVTINSLAQQVSEVNHRIAVAEAAGPSQQANDLHDQRDQLILELNKHIRTDVIEQTDGSFSIFFGNGQPLVVGTNVFSLSTRPATNDATRLVIGLDTPTGQSAEIPESLVTGGALGGLLNFRTESLDVAQNTLGRMALALSSAFNAQHKLGQDLTGTIGADFFRMPSPVITADTGNGTPTVNPGALKANVTDVSALTTSDYVLNYDSTGYTLRRVEDEAILFSGSTLPVTADGLTFIMDGTPAVGASFKIQATRYAARDIALSITDPRSIAAGLPVSASTSASNTGTATVSQGGLKTPVNLTYSGFSTGFTGFPAGSSVTVWNPATATSTTTTVTSTSQSVSIAAGSYATVNGITFQLSATPANGDTFTIGPNQLTAGDDNTGTAAISAAGHMRSTFTYTGGNLVLTPMPTPLLNTTITVTDGGVTTDYPIRLGNEAVPFSATATYTYNGVSFTITGGVPANGDTFTIGSGYGTAPITPSDTSATTTLTQTSTAISNLLPTRNYTLTYDNDNNILVGFPAGTTVAVTVNGTTTQVPITSPNQGVTFTSGMSIMVNGVEVNFNGVPANGDTFTIGPTTSNTTDSRNIQALAALQTSKIMLNGTASLESSYAQMVSAIGNKAREVEATYDAQSALLQQASDAVQSFSGVNLDEEAANLLRYQQAYQAAAKIIDISGKLFDLLASLG